MQAVFTEFIVVNLFFFGRKKKSKCTRKIGVLVTIIFFLFHAVVASRNPYMLSLPVAAMDPDNPSFLDATTHLEN
jgi:hypothetical protein